MSPQCTYFTGELVLCRAGLLPIVSLSFSVWRYRTQRLPYGHLCSLHVDQHDPVPFLVVQNIPHLHVSMENPSLVKLLQCPRCPPQECGTVVPVDEVEEWLSGPAEE